MTKLYTDDAELYDIAFDWDISEEVGWLFECLGRPGSLLEPGCGSGRMLEAFARLGVQVTGIDLSPRMIELARKRLGAGADLHVADMTRFDLGRTFDSAISPINTLLHLTPDELKRHLAGVAPHLADGGIYLVQVGLFTPESYDPSVESHIETGRGNTSLVMDCKDDEVDFARGVFRQRSRIEVLTGDRAGEVIEEVHAMTMWTPATWREAIDDSPFAQTATYDAGRKGERPLVGRDATGGLLWHELRLGAV